MYVGSRYHHEWSMDQLDKETLHSPGTSGRADLLIRFDALILRPHQSFKCLKTVHRGSWVEVFASESVQDSNIFQQVLGVFVCRDTDIMNLNKFDQQWVVFITLSVIWKS